jgi:FtsZ-binding cell division protein ZapB
MEKEILGFIDIGDAKTIEEFKEKFKTKFISREEVFEDDDIKKKIGEENNKFVGKLSGSLITKSKRNFGFTDEDIKDKKIEDVLEMGVTKLKAEIEELKGKQGQGSDEALKDAIKKAEKLAKERDDFKTANETLQGAYDKDKGDWEGKLRSYKVNHIVETAKGRISPKLKSDMSAVEKLGFDSVIKDFVIDFDDKETPFVKDKEGKRIPNPNKAGSFLSLEEAMESKANELNLIKKNNGQGGSPINPQFFQGNQQQTIVDPNIPVRKLHPNAIAHAEKLAAQRR